MGTTIRTLGADELQTVMDWAIVEGWNPGLHDAEIFYATDPQGFIGFEQDGELIASVSFVTYGRKVGFAGFFIVKPSYRGQGMRSVVYQQLQREARTRLDPDASIGIDAVSDLQPFYEGLGMQFLHNNIRMQGIGQSHPTALQACTSITDIPFEELAAYDTAHFGISRHRFLEHWIRQSNARAVAVRDDDRLVGYGVIRPCYEGWKIGPIFADHADAAETIFRALSDKAAKQPLYMDVPVINDDAMDIVKNHGMHELFTNSRMMLGPIPPINWQHVYGVTSFALG